MKELFNESMVKSDEKGKYNNIYNDAWNIRSFKHRNGSSRNITSDSTIF